MKKNFLRSCWPWFVTKFWWFWAADSLLAAFVIRFFLSRWIHGALAAHNILPWCGILLVLIAIVGGSLYLRAKGFVNAAVLTVAIIPLPLLLSVLGSVLLGLFYLLALLVASLFGHGRMN
ncbi:MAG: hypothetical protein ABI946_08845 [Chthoniobacterales bacterium]